MNTLDLLLSGEDWKAVIIARTELVQISFFEHFRYLVSGKVFSFSAPLSRAFFSPKDKDFRQTLGILGIRDAQEALSTYGEQCGIHYAQSGFLTTVRLRYLPEQKFSQIIGRYSPEEALDFPSQSHPEVLFI